MKLVLDGMGGDNAPSPQVEGAVLASKVIDDEIVITGDKTQLETELEKYKDVSKKISIVHTTQVIRMDEEPSTAYRHKKDSSLFVAVKMVADGLADAIISAGNSGAMMAMTLFEVKCIEGILRPAIATVFPTLNGRCVILDVGANVDSKPINLLQFAVMGRIYAQEVLDIKDPKVGLLSIGEENIKGNELTIQSFQLLKKYEKNFIGNIEGRDIPLGKADVVVCDGFVGNILLKFGEGIGEMLFKLIKSSLKKHPISWFSLPFIWSAIKDIRKKTDYSEYGAAPLLGVKGSCFICHGRSDAKAIKNALIRASLYVSNNITKKIEISIKNSNLENR